MPKSGIPDRWEDYSKVGKTIEGTPFVAFKVPLKEALISSLKPEEKFSPGRLLHLVTNLGLVIDLTYTARYYSPDEFLARGVKYCKILCPGRSVPSDTEFERFSQAVENYLEFSRADSKLIGVHCTHGLNRTGYMVCRYMITKMGFSPEKAVTAFEEARGHLIERTEYLLALGYSPLGDRPVRAEKSKHRSRKESGSKHRSIDSGPISERSSESRQTSDRRFSERSEMGRGTRPRFDTHADRYHDTRQTYPGNRQSYRDIAASRLQRQSSGAVYHQSYDDRRPIRSQYDYENYHNDVGQERHSHYDKYRNNTVGFDRPTVSHHDYETYHSIAGRERPTRSHENYRGNNGGPRSQYQSSYDSGSTVSQPERERSFQDCHAGRSDSGGRNHYGQLRNSSPYERHGSNVGRRDSSGSRNRADDKSRDGCWDTAQCWF